MKIRSVTVGIAQRLNVGDFEGVEPSVSATADLEEGDDLNAVKAQLYQQVQREWCWFAQMLTQAVIERRQQVRRNDKGYDQAGVVLAATDTLAALQAQAQKIG